MNDVSFNWLLAAIILTTFYELLGFIIWLVIIRSLDTQPSISLTFRAFSLSLLPKYVPGKFVTHGVRAKLAVPAGVSLSVAIKSSAIELFSAVASGSALAVPGVIIYYPAILEHVPLWTILAVVLFFFLLFPLIGRTASLFSFSLSQFSLNQPSIFLKASVLFIPLWLIMGMAHWCVANSLGSYEATAIPQLCVAVAISWIFGVLTFIAPAGLGVREATLYLLVRPFMEEEHAMLLAALSRLIMFSVDLLITAIAWLYFTQYHQGRLAIKSSSVDQ